MLDRCTDDQPLDTVIQYSIFNCMSIGFTMYFMVDALKMSYWDESGTPSSDELN